MSKKKHDPYELRYIYEQMELELIASMRRNLIKHKMDEQKAGFSWEMWQKAKLRDIQQYQKENWSIIYKARKYIQKAIESVLKGHFKKGQQNADNSMKKVSFPKDGENVGDTGKKPPKEENFFKTNEKKLNTMIDTTKKDFEKANLAIHRKMDDVYRQTIHNAKIQLTTGSVSLDKAIDIATEDFLNKGINSIAYRDKNGEICRYVNIATYAEMALRTASQRATFLGEGSKRDEYGHHLVIVSTHANCCELCYQWQGQILIDDVFSHPSEEYIAKYSGKYKLLSTAIKAGLLHPNCRHTIVTYFEGITRLPKIYSKEESKKNYNAEQKQRQLENKIRLAKRIKAGVADEDNKKEAIAMLRKYQKRLRDHLKANPGLKRHEHREKIYKDKLGKLGNGENDKSVSKKGEYVETIDIKDIDKFIEKYENEIKDYPIEHAYVIHEDGKVVRYVGDDKGVNIPVTGVENAVITHNHPIDPDINANCFGADDFGYLQQCGLKIARLRATYGDTRYEVNVLKDLSQLSFSDYRNRGSAMIDITADYIDMEENAYLLLAKEGYIEFAKTKVK